MKTEDRSDLPRKLSSPAHRALLEAGITRLAQVAELREADVRRMHGMGPKAIRTLHEALDERGLSFCD